MPVFTECSARLEVGLMEGVGSHIVRVQLDGFGGLVEFFSEQVPTYQVLFANPLEAEFPESLIHQFVKERLVCPASAIGSNPRSFAKDIEAVYCGVVSIACTKPPANNGFCMHKNPCGEAQNGEFDAGIIGIDVRSGDVVQNRI